MSDDKSTSMAPVGELQFVLGSEPVEFTWTVRVPVPGADDYRFAQLPLHFVAVDETELNRMRGIGLGPKEIPPSNEQICRQVVRGWPALKDTTGADVPFSPKALDKLLTAPMVAASIVATYLAAMSGMAARKNV